MAKAMVALLGHNVRNTTQPPEDTAMAIAGLCIGGMVVARSLNDSRFGDRLRDAATRAALMLGGWEPDSYGASSAAPPAPDAPDVVVAISKILLGSSQFSRYHSASTNCPCSLWTEPPNHGPCDPR